MKDKGRDQRVSSLENGAVNPKKIKNEQPAVSPYTAQGTENVPTSSIDGTKVE